MTPNSKQQTAKDLDVTGGPIGGDPFGAAYSFRNLAMWQRAQELADQVLDFIAPLPSERITNVFCQQVLRSVSSIAANIAEGHGRYAAGAYRNHLSIARGSCAETISWLDLMKRRRLITTEQERSALEKCAEIMKMLTAKMITLDKQAGTNRTLREERAPYDPE